MLICAKVLDLNGFGWSTFWICRFGQYAYIHLFVKKEKTDLLSFSFVPLSCLLLK